MQDNFSFAWVIPFAFLVLVFAVSYLRFLRHLPPRFQRLFILAGSLYVGGALGLEMVSAYEISRHGGSLAYLATSTVEESLEMAGIIALIYALLD